MTWNYRIMRKVEGKGTTHWYSYGIYEVYSQPKGWTEYPVCATGDTLDELKKSHEMMGEAFKKPILSYETGKVVKK